MMFEQVNGNGGLPGQACAMLDVSTQDICIICDAPYDVCDYCDAIDTAGRDCNFCDGGRDWR